IYSALLGAGLEDDEDTAMSCVECIEKLSTLTQIPWATEDERKVVGALLLSGMERVITHAFRASSIASFRYAASLIRAFATSPESDNASFLESAANLTILVVTNITNSYVQEMDDLVVADLVEA
ncbi:hypothetical protein HDU93_003392, partial [Gonapodya sp. JEL0774]